MNQSNFLPEDYIAKKAERRASFFGLFLFVIVMVGVIGAFFMTNRQWSIVKAEQSRINVQYAEAAKRIEELNELEGQKQQLLEKAEITDALVERIPRSILLAELINRMPDSVSLEGFELESKQIKKKKVSKSKTKIKSLSGKSKTPTKAEEAEKRKIEVPKYNATISLIGVAPTDVHVSEYISALSNCELLYNVELKYSRETEVEEEMLRQFRIEAMLNPRADAKGFEPILYNRTPRDPMKSTREINPMNQEFTEVTIDDREDD